MTKYTADEHALPYPEGVDRVAVAADLQALAMKTGIAITTESGRIKEEEIQPLVDRLTVGSTDPVSLKNRAPGHMHANRSTGALWVAQMVDGTLAWVRSPKNTFRGSARLANKKDPDTWLDSSYDGTWDLPNTASLDGAIADGYTPPLPRAHYVNHYTSAIGTTYQQAWSYDPDRMFFRAAATPATPMGTWSEVKKLTVESDMTSIFCAGESTTRGGDNGVDWPLGDAYPAKLAAALGGGVTVMNFGKGGAFTDEILLRANRKRIFVRVPAGQIPGSGATIIGLSWNPETDGPRWIELPGRINNVPITLDQNGTTGTWTAKRRVSGAAVPVSGWVEVMLDAKASEGGVHILWIGGNDSTRQVKGPHKSVVAHITAGIQAYKESLPAENHSLIVLGMHPSLGNAARLQDTLAVNAWCEENLPNNYVSVYDYMRGPALSHMGVTPTAEDQTLISQGYIPRSVLAAGDIVHPNKAFAAVMAERLLAPYIRDRGLVLSA